MSLWIWGYILCHQLSCGQAQQFTFIILLWGESTPVFLYSILNMVRPLLCVRPKHSVTLHIPRLPAFSEEWFQQCRTYQAFPAESHPWIFTSSVLSMARLTNRGLTSTYWPSIDALLDIAATIFQYVWPDCEAQEVV